MILMKSKIVFFSYLLINSIKKVLSIILNISTTFLLSNNTYNYTKFDYFIISVLSDTDFKSAL